MWCEAKLEELEKLEDEEKNKGIVSASQIMPKNNGKAQTSNPRINPERSDDVDSALENEVAIIQEKLFLILQKISRLEDYLKAIRNNSLHYKINEDLNVKRLILKKTSNMSVVESEFLNKTDITVFLKNVVELSERLKIKIPMYIEKATATNLELLTTINNINPNNILHKDANNYIKELLIEGQVNFNNTLKVVGLLNGVKFAKNQILLNTGDQRINTNLIGKNLTIDYLSSLNSDDLHSRDTYNITTKSFIIDGLINNINISNLVESALKTSGHQEINAQYVFDNLKVNDLRTITLAGKRVPEDFIFIKGEPQEVEHDVQFESGVIFNKLFVKKRLNNINVDNDGKLDVLLKNVSYTQYIDGYKLLENVEILNNLKYRGKMDEKLQQMFGHVTFIRNPIEIDDNVTISGTATLENQLNTSNIETIDKMYSIKRLENALKLSENIPIHLKFKQQLNVNICKLTPFIVFNNISFCRSMMCLLTELTI